MRALSRASAAFRRALWIAAKRQEFQASGERRPRLLVDISAVARHDARTGIQRVVRAVWSELRRRNHDRYDFVPVYAGGTHGYRVARWDCSDDRPVLTKKVAAGGKEDIFLGLDLSAHYLPLHAEQVVAWREAGTQLHFVVYDLLPLDQPQWFTKAAVRHFERWFDVVRAQADGLVCISDEVARRVQASLGVGGPAIKRLFLSGELARSRPTRGICDAARTVASKIAAEPAALIVGTLEPRKGHHAVLKAFERLWECSADGSPLLVVVGKAGWKTEALQAEIKAHPEYGRRLFWLQSATDEALDLLFASARLVIVASHAEGFGLPVAEAAQHNRWVLARDLPVFREQPLTNMRYFSDDAPDAFAATILAAMAEAGRANPLEQRLLSWEQCVDRLLIEIGVESPREDKFVAARPVYREVAQIQ